VVVVVPAVGWLTSCSGGSGMQTDGPSNGFTVTSAAALGHSHELFVPFDDLDQPPTGGVSRTTNASSTYSIGAHTHVVALTVDQLTSIMHGGTVSVSSLPTAGHSHEFSIRMP
jgi:hypothetical protein